MKKAIILLILLLALPNASAIKILIGGDNKIFFEPNLVKEYTFIVSDAERSATVPIALKGAMAKYATVEPTVLDMLPGEQKEIRVKLQLPEFLEKGVHALVVSATEHPKGAQTGAFIWIPAVAATLKIINTDIDYDCSLGTFTASIGANSANILINAANGGRKEIEGAYADLAIYSSEGMPVTNWKAGPFGVPAFDSKTIESTAEFQTMPPGQYSIKGTLFCADKKIDLSSDVINPATSLKINDFRAYKKDGNLYIEFDLENEHDAPISAYGILWFYNGEKNVDHTGLPSVTVPPKGKTIMGISPNLDWVPIPPGTYTIKGDITYLGRKEQRETTITLTEEDLSKKSTGGGFTVAQQKAEEQRVVLEKPSAEGMSKKTIIRIIAGLLILVLLTIFVLKILAAKRE